MKRRNLLKLGVASLALPLIPNSLIAECEATSKDILGPFYTENAPTRNIIYPNGALGTKIFLTGTVYYDDCETPISDTLIELWQADSKGAYDNIGFDYRAKFSTDALGNYSCESILPGKYLNGKDFRPRHIHFKITSGGQELVTQLYFEGDTSIPNDPWASDSDAKNRIIPLSPDSDGNLHGVFDIILPIDKNGYSSAGESSSQRIISINPNPITSDGIVKCYYKGSGKLELKVYDINGRFVKTIIATDSYSNNISVRIDALDANGIKLMTGVYIIQLLINDKLIDAKRFIVK